jgi:sugar phosphate isomerase/epimerase
MTATEEQFFAPVGTGVIDWPKIFKKQGLSGMKYFYVEQDAFQGIAPLQSIEKSIQYLKTL